MKYSKFFQEDRGVKLRTPNIISRLLNRGTKERKEKKEFYPYFKNPLEKKRYTKSVKFQAHKLKKVLGFIAFILVICWGVFIIKFFVYDSTYFDVRDILAYGAQKFVNPEDLKILVDSNLEVRNIFYIDTKKLEEDLNKNFLEAKKITLKKVMPDKLSVTVIERSPLALLYQEVGGELFLIDEEGYVLGKVAPEYMDLPKIQYTEPIEIGKFVAQEIVPVTRQIIEESSANGLKLSSMSFKPKYTKVYLVDSAEVYLNNEKDFSFSLKLLSSLMKRLTLEGKKVEMVDLRYDKVIVK